MKSGIWKILLVIVILTAAAGMLCVTARAESKSYTVSVTIPALIGVNVAMPEQVPREQLALAGQEQEFEKLLYTTEIRDQRQVRVQTVVVR